MPAEIKMEIRAVVPTIIKMGIERDMEIRAVVPTVIKMKFKRGSPRNNKTPCRSWQF